MKVRSLSGGERRPARRARARALGTGRQPLYARVALALSARIEAGDHPVGSLLPTETELQRRFGVSRYVVRQAIQHLRSAGLVSARKGVGTKVEARAASERYLYSMRSLDDILQYASATRLEVAEQTSLIVGRGLALALGCRPGRRFVRIVGVRFAALGGPPICHSEVYVDTAFEAITSEIGAARTAIWALIESRFGERLSEVEQSIEAVTLEGEMAGLLAARTGAPALRITRRYFAAGRRLIEVSISIHPADRFSYAMTIKRDLTGPQKS